VTFIESAISSTIDSTTAQTITHSFQSRLLQLSFLIFLALNSIIFSWFLTLLLVLFLKLLDSTIFHLFSNLCIGSKNLCIGSKLFNAFTTKFSQSRTKHPISQPLLSPKSSPSPICHSYSLLCYCHAHTPHGLLSTQNNRQIIYSLRTCSLERSSKRTLSTFRSFFSS